jgi:dienelactone hydrolase
MPVYSCLLVLLVGVLGSSVAVTQNATPTNPPTPPPPAVSKQRISLDDLYSTVKLPDVAISPSGRYLATIVRTDAVGAVLIWDLESGKYSSIARMSSDAVGKGTIARLLEVFWKTEDRLLIRLSVRPDTGARIGNFSDKKLSKLGSRLFAIDRDGGNIVGLLAANRNSALAGAFNLGAIASFLPKDRDHIIMNVDGFDGRSLFKVNINTGVGEMVERPVPAVVGWWLDVNGTPIVRVDYLYGSYRLRRKDADGNWKVFYKIRERELNERPDYEAVGPSDVEGEYFVLARPDGRDRIGLYRYKITEEKFGDLVYEHPQFDLVSARISRDGKRVLNHCHIAHVLVCEFADRSLEAHMRGIRKYFDDAADVRIYDTSEDQKVLVLYVEGPQDPPSFHRYRTDVRSVQDLGPLRESLLNKLMPTASVVEWKARDGLALTGYLTRPPGSRDAKALPLVVHPHGGPERRDSLTFDPWVQYFAARGYAVLQPNFRGSEGFGKKFAELGYGEWGGAMQDDVTDVVQHLAQQGTIDPNRVCIVGASYGGYAALAGAALTPDLYRCAVSVAGVTDLEEFIAWRKKKWGSESEGYTYWLKSIGDPARDSEKLAATSPARLVQNIKIPVLLVHGDEDFIVPVSQSVAMKKALDKSGRKTDLIRFADEGHSDWSDENEKHALLAIDRFLWQHLGPGHGIDAAPPPLPAEK